MLIFYRYGGRRGGVFKISVPSGRGHSWVSVVSSSGQPHFLLFNERLARLSHHLLQTSERISLRGTGKIIRRVRQSRNGRPVAACRAAGWRGYLFLANLFFCLIHFYASPCLALHFTNPRPGHCCSAGTALHNLHSTVSVINSVNAVYFICDFPEFHYITFNISE